jgi:hypothetical protein
LERGNLELRERVAQQEERAAKAEKALLELQERTRPRHLTSSQRAFLVKALAETKFKGIIEIQIPLGQAESHDFGLEISAVLKEAGWTAEINDRVMIVGTPPVNLILKVRVAESEPDRAIPLAQIFMDSGLPLTAQVDPSLPADKVVLLIGSKKP